ncbi:collagen-binding domain-containing protein [uncultured Ruminococcus sp.]|uniref:collagen-binding domain-containing protein n=1 Tax=uncultured Ruminococcus sp. TaxID=165186 RepID=UPI0025E0CD29|nr:collagen-binding domain-containing protein [uncultured Ruminococcus sp.]
MKMNAKRSAAAVTALMVSASAAAIYVSANSVEYSKPYTIENALSDFQYFVKGDLTGGGPTGGGHTVGAIAVGGVMNKTNTFGDGQVNPSYIYDIETANFGSGKYYEGNKTVYYGVNNSEEELPDNFKQNNNYIDMDQAFESICQESLDIANTSAYVCTEADLVPFADWAQDTNQLNIDVTKGSINIPWTVYEQTDIINLVFDDVEYFKENPVYISVSDVPEDVNFSISFNYGISGKNGRAYVRWNGEFCDNYIMQNLEGGTNGNQINLEGFKLVWNVPDAKSASIAALGGHFVAPNANVSIDDSGRLEGGVIARNMNDGGAQAHYFPFSTPTISDPIDDDSSSQADPSSDIESSSAADPSSAESSSSMAESSAADTSSDAESSSDTDTSRIDDSTSKSDNSSTADSSSQADSSSDTDSSSQADSSSDIDSSSQADSSSDTDSSSQADSSSDTDSSSEADSSSDTDSSSEADSSSDIDSSSQVDSSSDIDSSSQADSSSDTDSSSEADSSSDTDSSSEADSSSDTDSSSQADSSSDTDSSSQADSSSDTDSSSNTDSSDSSSESSGIVENDGGKNSSNASSNNNSQKVSSVSSASVKSANTLANPSTGAGAATGAAMLAAAAALVISRKNKK